MLIVLAEVDPGILAGASRAFLRIAPELERRGFELTYWTASPSATQRELEAAGAEVHGVARELRFSLRQLLVPPGPRQRLRAQAVAVRSFAAALPGLRADVVVGNTVGALPELCVARLRRLPTVLYVHEIMPPGAKYALARRLLAAISDEIAAVSSAAARPFAFGGHIPAVVPNGIEAPTTAVRAAAARRRERRADRVVVGALGTISRRKGTDLLVAAARILARSAPEVELRLAGEPIEGAERPRAERVLEQARVAGIAHLPRVEPFAELPRWDVLVVPSRQDPLPNVVLEALAIGLPVIGAGVGGIPEQLGEGAGVLVRPEDPEALAAAIAELARDPERRQQIAAAGRERARRLFSLGAQADGLEAALRAAQGGRAR